MRRIRNFDLPTFVQKAFKQLKSDVTLSTDVTIGEGNFSTFFLAESAS